MTVIVTEIHDHHRSLLNQHLHQFLGDLDPDALALLHERFEWVEVTGGETLIEQGAPGFPYTYRSVAVFGRRSMTSKASQSLSVKWVVVRYLAK